MANETQQAVPIRFRVSLAGYTRIRGVRGSRQYKRMYLSGVSYRGNSGYVISKFSYRDDAAQAQTFSKVAAEEIAAQLRRGGYQGLEVEAAK